MKFVHKSIYFTAHEKLLLTLIIITVFTPIVLLAVFGVILIIIKHIFIAIIILGAFLALGSSARY